MPKAFPKEFREDVIRVYRDSHSSITQVAKDFGISPSCLKGWLTVDERRSSRPNWGSFWDWIEPRLIPIPSSSEAIVDRGPSSLPYRGSWAQRSKHSAAPSCLACAPCRWRTCGGQTSAHPRKARCQARDPAQRSAH
jgi:hypothetical protein